MNNDIIIIKLDRERQLKFDHTAMRTLVAISGKSAEEIDSSLNPNDLDQLEKMLYCALLKDAKDNNETIVMENIPELMDHAPFWFYTFDKVREAWFAAWGVKVEKVTESGNQQPVEGPAENHTTGEKANE